MIYDIVYTVVYVVLAQIFCSAFSKRKELSFVFYRFKENFLNGLILLKSIYLENGWKK